MRRKKAKKAKTVKKRSFAKFAQRLEEIELREEVEDRCLRMHVTLQDLYEGRARGSVKSARSDVYAWLHKTKGKSVNEVARLFDRAPSGVLKLVRKSS